MERDPDDRFSSAADMEELRRLLVACRPLNIRVRMLRSALNEVGATASNMTLATVAVLLGFLSEEPRSVSVLNRAAVE